VVMTQGCGSGSTSCIACRLERRASACCCGAPLCPVEPRLPRRAWNERVGLAQLRVLCCLTGRRPESYGPPCRNGHLFRGGSPENHVGGDNLPTLLPAALRGVDDGQIFVLMRCVICGGAHAVPPFCGTAATLPLQGQSRRGMFCRAFLVQ
jgi:hypothetical protein